MSFASVYPHYIIKEIDDPIMQKVLYLDKLIDELAKGKRWKRF